MGQRFVINDAIWVAQAAVHIFAAKDDTYRVGFRQKRAADIR